MIVALTGIVAGIVHVLTGPDHLAAVAPLAVRRPKRAWLPGVRWGFDGAASPSGARLELQSGTPAFAPTDTGQGLAPGTPCPF